MVMPRAAVEASEAKGLPPSTQLEVQKWGAAAAPSDDTLTVGRLYARVGHGLPSTLRASAVPG